MAEEIDPDGKEIQMIYIIDELATRYSMLPSEIMFRANTFDIAIMDISQGYRNYIQEQANANSSGQVPPAPKLSQDQMQEMLRKVKAKNENQS